MTPLAWAAREGHAAVVQLLLERGADKEANENVRRPAVPRGVGGRAVLRFCFAGHFVGAPTLVRAQAAAVRVRRGADLEHACARAAPCGARGARGTRTRHLR